MVFVMRNCPLQADKNDQLKSLCQITNEEPHAGQPVGDQPRFETVPSQIQSKNAIPWTVSFFYICFPSHGTHRTLAVNYPVDPHLHNDAHSFSISSLIYQVLAWILVSLNNKVVLLCSQHVLPCSFLCLAFWFSWILSFLPHFLRIYFIFHPIGIHISVKI